MNFREERLEIAADAQKIRFHGLWAVMTALKSNVITEGFRGRVDRNAVHFAESKIRVGCGSICARGRAINCHTKKNGPLVNQAIHCPREPSWLPGRVSNVHFLTAPSASRGG